MSKNPFAFPQMKKMGKLPADKELNENPLSMPTSPMNATPGMEKLQDPKPMRFKKLAGLIRK